MKKELLLADGKIILIKNPGYCIDFITIERGYIIDGVITKIFRMSIWDDISFVGYSFDDSIVLYLILMIQFIFVLIDF